MLIVGELINSTRKSIAKAIEEKDGEYLRNLASQQVEAGAHYIDINSAEAADELATMKWLIDLIQDAVDVPLCLDSPNPQVIQECIGLCRKTPMINSISAEPDRWEQVLPIVRQYKTKVIALCMDEKGIPNSTEERLRIADRLVLGLTEEGVPEDDIYLDPLIKPIGVNSSYGAEILETIWALRHKYPNVHIISGLSNISYGLPERKLVNRVFMVMSVAMGMDSFILDPLNQQNMSELITAQMVGGHDKNCRNYLSSVRKGRILA